MTETMGDTAPAKSGVPTVRMGVGSGSASEFEFWRWAVSPMFDIGPADPETYRMQTTVSFVGPIAVSATVSSAMSLDRSSRIIARGGVDDVVVQIYHEGGHLFSFGGREIEVFAGDIALIDLTRPCRILAQSFRNASLVLRRSALKAFDIDVESLHGGILRRGSVLNTLLREYMASLAAYLPDAAASETDRIARGTASLVAASFGPSERREQGEISSATLPLARRAIEARLRDPDLGPETLQRQLGVSRSPLYKMFEPLGGVRGYIQSRRLSRAFEAIVKTDAKIGAIAEHWGFANVPTFNRLFRETFGMSPSDARAAARAGILSAAARGERGELGHEFVNRWLMGLDPAS